MEKNAANWDRILRGIVGIILLAIAVINYSTLGVIAIVLGILGAIMLFVALTGFCLIYKILGFQTLKKESKSKK
jgi:membrane-bound ClpP family serine protease